MLGLIWVQTACKAFQQMALAGKELHTNLQTFRTVKVDPDYK